MDLFYREFGEGPPVFILHGLFGSSDNWKTLARKFGEKFRVITVDQRNHGQSFHDKVLNYDVMVDDLKRLFDQLNIERASLIGHSMGGKTAMKFAIQNPDRVDKLIVVDIAPRYYPVHHDAIIDALCELDIEDFERREEADEILAESIENRAVRQFLLKNLTRNEEGQLTWRINLPVIRENLEKIGAEIGENQSTRIPALFIAGNQSHYIQKSDEKQIRERFPNSEIIYFKGVGHWIHAEAPKEFYHAVVNYLNA